MRYNAFRWQHHAMRMKSELHLRNGCVDGDSDRPESLGWGRGVDRYHPSGAFLVDAFGRTHDLVDFPEIGWAPPSAGSEPNISVRNSSVLNSMNSEMTLLYEFYTFKAILVLIALQRKYNYSCIGKGPSIYDVHKKSDFWPPSSPCPHEPDPTPLCGRPHVVDMKYTSLSWNG